MKQYIKIKNFAENIAHKVGALIINRLNDKFIIENKSKNDFVTDVDRLAENMIRQEITKNYPEHIFFGEETVSVGLVSEDTLIQSFSPEEYIWVIDPIDGTTNFIQGIPQFAVSIGIVHNLQIQVAVVYDPSRDEMFSAVKSGGAFINGKKITVSNTEKLSDAIVSTSFPAGIKMRKYITGMIGHIEHDISSLRIWNCAALCLAYVACGRTDAHFEPGIHLWDMAAGKLIVEEAGGKISDLSGQAYQLNQRNIIATNNKLAKEFINMIQ